MRRLFVAAEIALAIVLLVGAGLMVRTFLALQAIDPGWNPDGVLSLEVSVGGTRHAAPERREALYRDVLERLADLPGVSAAGAINHLPIAGDVWRFPYAIEGRPAAAPGESPLTVYRAVLPGYFAAMRLPVASTKVLKRARRGAFVALASAQASHANFAAIKRNVASCPHIQFGPAFG